MFISQDVARIVANSSALTVTQGVANAFQVKDQGSNNGTFAVGGNLGNGPNTFVFDEVLTAKSYFS